MRANYHTHTPRCNHASGTEREYIECALEAGIQILGFSDHTPHPFKDGYVSRIRMTPEQLGGYCDTLSSLRNEYKDRLELHIGLEAEYFPKYFREYLAMLADHPVEYLILGQHFIPDEIDGIYSGAPTADEDILKRYCALCMEAMQAGVFTYIAHPDLIHYTGAPDVYRRYMGEMLREAMNCGMPAEINMLGLTEGRHYPSRQYLEVLAENNCPVILGCDAHTPQALLPSAILDRANALVREYGLTLWETVNLKKTDLSTYAFINQDPGAERLHRDPDYLSSGSENNSSETQVTTF